MQRYLNADQNEAAGRDAFASVGFQFAKAGQDQVEGREGEKGALTA